MKIIAIVGARPQFIKHFSFEKACENKLELITIHTGQHYDANMSDVFFHQLGMNKPNYMLNIGSGKHGEQTARMMIEIENIIEDEHPDGIVIYGDTNSSLSGALVASKIGTPIFHIEAGLRSFNREMPEEINRVLVDHLSSVLFTPSNPAVLNLKKEGILDGVHTVGDIMKDLVRYAQKEYLINQNSVDEKYYYVTIHRPYNTDDPERLGYVLQKLNDLDNTRQHGYITGISNIFIRELKQLELHKRPIHCSDIKREILYVKDNNIWEKANNENTIMKGAINSLAKRQIDNIKEWEQANPYWNTTEEGNNKYIQMVQSITECNDDKIDNKIIKTIAKEVIIDK